MSERATRANFTLDEDVTSLVRQMLDDHEKQHGFRPSMAQMIGGLIKQAAKEPRP